jgi:hypothetical protein
MLRYLRNLLVDLIDAAIIAALVVDLIDAAIIAAFAFTLVVIWVAGTTP